MERRSPSLIPQYRGFEVPAPLAANLFQELQIESGTGIIGLLVPKLSEVRAKSMPQRFTDVGTRVQASVTFIALSMA